MRKFATLFTMLMLFSALAFGQDRMITGTVTDDAGAAVQNASVSIKGTTTGTVADATGKFTIKAKTGDVLVITGTNIENQEVTVGSGSALDVRVRSKTKTETEVTVVTALGIRKRPKELGSSQTTVTNALITNGKSPNLGSALAGKVAGLNVTNGNNSVFGDIRVTIRGQRSISGDNQGMVVLDGVPVPRNTLNYLNPNDIESVTVLRGANASTLYGSEGINGALLITTKKGANRKPTVTFSHSSNVDQVSFLPKFQNGWGNGSGYGGLTAAGNYRSYENQSYGDAYDGSIRPLGRTAEDGSVYYIPYTARPKEKYKVWDVGYTMQNDVSLSGGDATSTFYISLQDVMTKGVTPGDDIRRDNARFSASKQYGKFKAAFTANYAQDRYEIHDDELAGNNFYELVMNTPGYVPLRQLRDWKNDKFASPNGYFNDYYNSPWFELDNNRRKGGRNYFNGSLDLNLKMNDNIEFIDRVGIASTQSFSKTTQGKFSYTAWARSQAFVPAPFPNDYNGINRAASDVNGGVRDRSGYASRINNDLMARFTKKLTSDLKATLILGQNIQVRKSKDIVIGSNSVVVPDLFNIGVRSGELVGTERNTEVRKFGYYSDLTFGYKDYLFLHGSFRRDGTSLFYADTRKLNEYTYNYYGGDISFILTDAFDGIKSDFFNYAKLRASVNKNGNDNIDVYGLFPQYPVGAGFPYGTLVGQTVGGTLPATDLKPEFITSYEIGGEFQFWKNRINLDASAFKQISKGQILDISVSDATGYQTAKINSGRVDNWGVETELKVKLLNKRDLTWDVNANYSYNDNKVKSLYGDLNNVLLNRYTFSTSDGSSGFIYAEIGKPFPYLKTTQWQRDAAGKVIVNAVNGYPGVSNKEKNWGGTLPKHILGLGTTVKYKNIAFSANAEYRGGNYYYHGIAPYLVFTGIGFETGKYNRESFIFPNSVILDNTGKSIDNTSVPVEDGWYEYWDHYHRRAGENFVTSGAFWKLRDVSITYDFPKKWFGMGKVIKAMTLGVNGRNLVILTPKNNIYGDPEFSGNPDNRANANGNGVGLSDTQNTPPYRSFGATLNITF